MEDRVKQEILQEKAMVDIGGKIYDVEPPTIATLIMLSEKVSKLPNMSTSEDKVLNVVLKNAKDMGLLGDIVAILVLGAKKVQDIHKGDNTILQRIKTRILHRLGIKQVNEYDKLKNEILFNLSPMVLNKILAELLGRMQIGDFFAISVFLTDLNIIKTEDTQRKAE